MDKPTDLTDLTEVVGLSAEEREDLQPVCQKFPFRSNSYYMGLIDWNDPHDPVRRIIVPDCEELAEWGDLDPSNEGDYRVAPGLEHKYPDTALMLVSDVCAGVCRFCFRKRLFMCETDETRLDVSESLGYIRAHTEITDVLVSGGDPLVLPTHQLRDIIGALRDIEHVQAVRIGTKMPAFNPYRILDDPSLLEMVEEFTTAHKRLYFMVHFDHPRELSDVALRGLQMLQKAGAILCNQAPMIRGLNDDVDTLVELFRTLAAAGVSPYYVFQCRPTVGNAPYSVPIEEGYTIFRQAQDQCSGLAKRARFAMSHATGKIEIAGVSDGLVYVKYHRAHDSGDYGRMLTLRSNPEARWLDDYAEAEALTRQAGGGMLVGAEDREAAD